MPIGVKEYSLPKNSKIEMATTSNVLSDKMNTRMRKHKNLETAMDTIKKLLKPDKKGSRKKNKPRSILKKVQPKKIQRSNQNVIEDVEFFPNKLKRTAASKKIFLKPKNRLKIVVAVNKRKRGTPHKGIQWAQLTTDTQTDSNILKQTVHKPMVLDKNYTVKDCTQKQFQITKEECDSQHLTLEDVIRINEARNKDLISKKLTMDVLRIEELKNREVTSQNLTLEDKLRMDEDALSDEDLLEILTCPSPVWWEDPPDIDRDALLPLKITQIIDTTGKKGINQNSKRTNISDSKRATKKAKLENILDSIRNRVGSDNKNDIEDIGKNYANEIHNQNDDNLMVTGPGDDDVNNYETNAVNNDNNDVNNDTNDGNDVNNDNNNSEESNPDDSTKLRKISTSGSEVSLNEEDLVRNLQSIDIPIQNHGSNSDAPSTDDNKTKDNTIDVNVKSPIDETEYITDNLEENKQNDTSEFEKSVELRNKEHLQKLHKENNDILDVRIIKTPSNVTNEVTIWSAVGDFKPLDPNIKKTTDIIDVEDELQFSIIESDNKNVNNDKVDATSDLICINDDSNEGNGDVIYLDDSLSYIGDPESEEWTDVKITDVRTIDIEDNSRKSDSVTQKDIETVNEKDISKEDTIKMCNLNVRVIETSSFENTTDEKSLEITKMNEEIEIATDNEVSVLESSEVNKNPVKIDKNTNSNKNTKEINTNNSECVQHHEPENYRESNEIGIINDENIFENNSIISDIETEKSEINTYAENKNDISNIGITSVPQVLTILSKYAIQYALDSPRSVKSTTESLISDGTISDTNIQFIDEYIKSGDEDNISMVEEYLDDDFGEQNVNPGETSKDLNEALNESDFGEQNVNPDKQSADLNEGMNESELVFDKLVESSIKEKKIIEELVTVYRIVDKKNDENHKIVGNIDNADYDSDLTDTDNDGNDDNNDQKKRDKNNVIK